MNQYPLSQPRRDVKSTMMLAVMFLSALFALFCAYLLITQGDNSPKQGRIAVDSVGNPADTRGLSAFRRGMSSMVDEDGEEVVFAVKIREFGRFLIISGAVVEATAEMDRRWSTEMSLISADFDRIAGLDTVSYCIYVLPFVDTTTDD